MLIGNQVSRSLRILLAAVFVVGTLAALVALLTGCGERGKPDAASSADPAGADAGAGARLRVFAPNAPFASLIEDLVGAEAEIVAPWRAAGGDPAYWRPTADDIALIQSCGLIVLNGAGHEKWAEQAALPRTAVLDLSAFVRESLIEEAGETHSHGPEGQHSHMGTAFTTWLSPTILRRQLRELSQALVDRLPTVEHRIESRRDANNIVLATMETRLAELGKKQPVWLASHPVYQYLGQAGGLAIESFHWEPGAMPAETEWTKFRLARLNAPKPKAWMLWEGEPGPEIRAKLEAESVEAIVFSPQGSSASGSGGGPPFVRYALERVEAMLAAVP